MNPAKKYFVILILSISIFGWISFNRSSEDNNLVELKTLASNFKTPGPEFGPSINKLSILL